MELFFTTEKPKTNLNERREREVELVGGERGGEKEEVGLWGWVK